jgi:hypothetical protein
VKLGSIWSGWKWLDLDANYTTNGHCFWCKLPPTTQFKSFQWKSTIQRDNDFFSSLDYCLLWHIFIHENFCLLLKIWIGLQFFSTNFTLCTFIFSVSIGWTRLSETWIQQHGVGQSGRKTCSQLKYHSSLHQIFCWKKSTVTANQIVIPRDVVAGTMISITLVDVGKNILFYICLLYSLYLCINIIKKNHWSNHLSIKKLITFLVFCYLRR